MVLLVASSASAIVFETYTRDLDTNNPIASTITVGGVTKQSGGSDDKASFILDINVLYDSTYYSTGHRSDTDPVFFDEKLYNCEKGKDCTGMFYGNFLTNCVWKESGRWECTVYDKRGNSVVFLYFGKVGNYQTVGRVNWLGKNVAPVLQSISDVSFKETDFVSVQASATDVENDEIHYSLENASQGMSIDQHSGLISWQTDYDDAGVYHINVFASDGYDHVSTPFTLTIEKTNRAPDVSDPSIIDTDYYKSSVLTCNAGTASDPDPEDVANLQPMFSWYFDNFVVSGQNGRILDCGSVSGCDKHVDIKCSESVSDGDLSSSEKFSNEIVISNSIPLINSADVSQNIKTDDTITCTPNGWSDADSDSEGYDYSWSIDGSAVSGETSSTFDCGAVNGCNKGSVVECAVTPNDGEDTGASQNAQTTILNTAPSISDVSVSSGVLTDGVIDCSVVASDVDSDSLSYSYAWYKNSVLIGGETTSQLSGSNFDKGDRIKCDATVSDDTDSTSVSSDEVTVSNSAPSIIDVSISQNVRTNDLITCTPNGWSDADGDSASYKYVWSIDDSTVSDQTSSIFDCGTVSGCDKDVVVKCDVTPTDGFNDGVSKSAQTTILNTIPSIAGVNVASPAFTDTTIVCSANGWNDVDGDSANYIFAWFNNDVLISGQTSNSLAGDNFVKNDVIDCQITPNDGDEDGFAVEGSVTISNSAPALSTNPSLNSTTPFTDDVLSCVKGTFADIDGDSEFSSSFRWFENGVQISGQTAQDLDLSVAGLDKNDVIYCEQSVSDGTDSSAWYSSNNATIANSAPIFDHALANQFIGEDMTLSYDVNASDIDNDVLNYSVDDSRFSFDADGVLTWTPPQDWVGTVPLTVTVSDGDLSASGSFDVIVDPINDAPYLVSNISDIAWPEDSVYTNLNLSQYFADVDNPSLSYYSTSPVNVAVSIDNNTGMVTLTPAANFSGIDTIVFSTTDGMYSVDSNIVILNVTPVNDAPSVSIIPDITFVEDSTFNLNLSQYFSDVDGDSLTFTSSTPANVVVSIVNGVATFTPALNFNGLDSVYFTAFDPSSLSADSNVVSINVTPVNDAPVITSSPITNAFEDSLYSYDVDASDVDGDILDYSLVVSPLNMTINSTTGLIGWLPLNDDVGNHAVTVQVSDDAGGITTQSFNVNQSFSVDVNNTNDNPIVSTIPNMTWNEDVVNSNLNLSDYFSDVDVGDDLNWTATPVDNIIIFIDNETGIVNMAPDANFNGVRYVVFTAYDGTNSTQSNNVTLNITAVNDAPTISNVSISPLTAHTDSVLTCSVVAEDIDSSPIYANFSWFNNDVLIPGEITENLSGTNFNKSDSIVCNVVVYDDQGDFDTLNSSAVFIQNSVPVVSNINITPQPANILSDLTGSGVYFDADGDVDNSTYRWFVNGNLTGETSQFLSHGNFSQADIVTFEFTPYDGTVAGTAINSSDVLIYTVPPVVIITSPANNSMFTSQSFNINVSTDNNAVCWYVLNNSVSANITTLPATAHFGSVNTSADGSFELTVYCSDFMGSTGQNSVLVSVDSVIPVVTINSPVNNLYDYSNITLDVLVSEVVDCNYSLNGGAQQVLFTSVMAGNTTVTANHSSNTIVVSCADAFSNSNTSSISFTTDIIAPADITPTATPIGTQGKVKLDWIAPGDDNMTGTVSSFVLKQSTSPITNMSEFDAANFVTGSESVTVSIAGTSKTFNATGLVNGVTYYFVIVAYDDVGHYSNPINVSATPVSHDVAVNSVTNNMTVTTTYVGDSVGIIANVSNNGGFAESVNVSLKENGVVKSSQTVNLSIGASQNIAFTYVPSTAGMGKSLTVEAAIPEIDADSSDNSGSISLDVWSVANYFNLTFVDALLYPNATETNGSQFYVWAKIVNLNANSFKDLIVSVDTDGLNINDSANGNTSSSYTIPSIKGFESIGYWWLVDAGAVADHNITVSIGNVALGDNQTITRSVSVA